MSESQLIFATGLINFERELVKRISSDDPGMELRIVDLSTGIDLIGENEPENSGHEHNNGHRHGVDPHIWSAPNELRAMSRTAYERIALLYPDSAKYTLNFNRLMNLIDSLDTAIRAKTVGDPTKIFLIYHPALAYWARAYGYEQIALENDGKEPSADYLRQIADRARQDDIRKIFYQAQFSRQTVETLAAEIGAQPVEIDPLAEDLFGNLIHITSLITEQ